MKKLSYLLSGIAMIALLSISCQKESIDELNNELSTEILKAEKITNWSEIKAKGLELLWDLDAEEGYLYTKDTSNGALWGWTNNSTAYGNITAPIAYYLYKANLKEAGLAGFDAMYAKTSTNLNAFNSADLGVILYAYRATADSKFLDLANNMTANWIAKYPADGFPFRAYDTYWGYDAMNWMRSVYYIKHTTGLDQSLMDWADESILAYDAAYGMYAEDNYHAVYTNVISSVYRYGTFTPVSLEDVIALDDSQIYAYARIGKTTKKELYPEMADALLIENGIVSEIAAELVFALSR